MSTESIQFNLRERFAAPLPEFYRRRIVFWKDEDREFEKDVDELNLEGVKIIKLTGTNNFAVKKLLLHDDLDSNDKSLSCCFFSDGNEFAAGIAHHALVGYHIPAVGTAVDREHAAVGDCADDRSLGRRKLP